MCSSLLVWCWQDLMGWWEQSVQMWHLTWNAACRLSSPSMKGSFFQCPCIVTTKDMGVGKPLKRTKQSSKKKEKTFISSCYCKLSLLLLLSSHCWGVFCSACVRVFPRGIYRWNYSFCPTHSLVIMTSYFKMLHFFCVISFFPKKIYQALGINNNKWKVFINCFHVELLCCCISWWQRKISIEYKQNL